MSINDTNLEEWLVEWGWWFGPRLGMDAVEAKGEGRSSHPIARAMEHAPGTRAKALRRLATLHRSGLGRRRAMGEAAGLVTDDGHARLAPCWSSDPVTGYQSQSAGSRLPDFGAAREPLAPPEVEAVHRAVYVLRRRAHARACALEQRYQHPSLSNPLRAQAMTAALGVPVSVDTYRVHLREARIWLSGRLCL